MLVEISVQCAARDQKRIKKGLKNLGFELERTDFPEKGLITFHGTIDEDGLFETAAIPGIMRFTIITPNIDTTDWELRKKFDQPEKLTLADRVIEIIDIRTPEDHPKQAVPIVLVPGWCGRPKIYRDSVVALAKLGRRIVSFGAPHGIRLEGDSLASLKTMYAEATLRKVAALLAGIKAKQLERIDAVGHSEGCLILTIAALIYPEKFRNIILFNPAGLIGQDTVFRLIKGFLSDNKRRSPDEKIPRRERRSRLAATLRLKTILGGGTKDFMHAWREAKAISRSDISESLGILKNRGIGVVIVHSVNDQIFPMERLQKTVKKRHIHGFYSIVGIHNILYTYARLSARLIDSILETLEKNLKKEPKNKN